MTAAEGRLIGRLEANARVLALAKLVNVGLAMLWGFVVTFVFVRLLPIGEFRGFLLLVAFANFTVSADFGFSGILYARLRRFRLGGEGAGTFRPAEVAVLFAFMGAVVLLGAALIGGGIASGHIVTGHAGLFMAFYLLTVTNIFALLTKRAMAALDHNLLWEMIDAVRRVGGIVLLLVALIGVPILLSVWVQIALASGAVLFGLSVVHRDAGMRAADWLLRGGGFGAMWRESVHDMGTTMLLTLSDVAAYNAPYFGLAWVTHDPRPLLVFDFVFKISRALSAVIRALTEAAMPRLTAAFHGGRPERARQLIGRLRLLSLGAALALGGALLVVGGGFSDLLFAGKAVLSLPELALLALLLVGLAILCVSTYVHNGFGRFRALLAPSFAFLLFSALTVPVGVWIAGVSGEPFVLCFLALYALAHGVLAVRHEAMLRGVVRA